MFVCTSFVEVLRRITETVIFPCKRTTSLVEICRDDESTQKLRRNMKILARAMPYGHTADPRWLPDGVGTGVVFVSEEPQMPCILPHVFSARVLFVPHMPHVNIGARAGAGSSSTPRPRRRGHSTWATAGRRAQPTGRPAGRPAGAGSSEPSSGF